MDWKKRRGFRKGRLRLAPVCGWTDKFDSPMRLRERVRAESQDAVNSRCIHLNFLSGTVLFTLQPRTLVLRCSSSSLMETKRTYDYKPTPEQLVLAEERRRQREAKKLQQQNTLNSHAHLPPTFLSRHWKSLPSIQTTPRSTIKVMSWNLLAQCLIRSNLFPTSSKALKTTHREPMIHAEILSHFADIMCMQEVDRLEKLSPVLEQAGYSSAYAKGPGKQHGCLIAYKQNKYSRLDELVIEYDKQEVREDSHPAARIGSSRVTKNIGFMVALAEAGADQKGVIVATTHLFWHPAFTYERARQAGILIREVLNFRQSLKLDHWPCIIAGDFNFAPDDPAYSLLVGDPLTEAQSHRLHMSRVIHITIDPTVPPTTKKADDEEGDGSEADPDRVINNSRVATSSDGLLSNPELVSLFINGAKLRSAYDEGQRTQRGNGTPGDLYTFGDRVSLPPSKLGAHEPMWTSYTHYWKTTLDYIFFLDTPKHSINVAGYLNPHRTTDMEAGLPQIGICGSDHVSLCAELFLS